MTDSAKCLPSHLKARFQKPGQRRSMSRSATRALDVMELFGAQRQPLRAIEITRLLDTNPSTANQLLKTMVDSAHLVFDARNKTYLPSPRLADFAGWMGDFYGSGGRLRDLVMRVHQATCMIVTATTPNDLTMQVIVSAEAGTHSAERGGRISLFTTVIGAAYLSTLDAQELRRLAYRARIPDDMVPTIEAEQNSNQRRGFAIGQSTRTDTWSLAMPIARELTRVPIVLGLSGPAKMVERDALAIVEQMRTIIHEVLQGGRAYI